LLDLPPGIGSGGSPRDTEPEQR